MTQAANDVRLASHTRSSHEFLGENSRLEGEDHRPRYRPLSLSAFAVGERFQTRAQQADRAAENVGDRVARCSRVPER